MTYQDVVANLPKWFTAITTENAMRYFLFGGIAWLTGYVLLRQRSIIRKIIPRWPARHEMLQEIAWSLLTVLMYGIVGTLSVIMIARRNGGMYYDIGRYGQTWFFVSIALTIVLHDAYFYWTHRAMHHPRLFRWFHAVHHRSKNPSPWSTYSFSPLEAIVQAGIFPLTVMLIPIHPLAFLVFMIWQLFWNVVGHAGFEFYPKWWLNSWLGVVFNTPTHHVQHHERIRGNYGLYFNFWDRLMGTNHREYQSRFEEVTERRNAALQASLAGQQPVASQDSLA